MIEIKINHIKFLDLTGQQPLLERINFLLTENNIYSIVGKNGSGKTTLINSITRLSDKNSIEVKGEILFNNLDLLIVNEKKMEDIRKKEIRYVFQDAANCFNPLKKFKYYFNEYINDPIEIDNLLDYFLLPPKNELLNMHSYEASGGMAQRINLILALLAKPKLLIMDEPTSAIDTPIANLIKVKLREYIRDNKSAVLIITQDIRFAKEVSDKVAVLQNNTLSDFVTLDQFHFSDINFTIQNSDQSIPGVV